MVGRRVLDVFVLVVSRVEQQRRIAADADFSDAEEQRAGRLTVAFDAKRLSRRIICSDNGIESRKLPSLSIALG